MVPVIRILYILIAEIHLYQGQRFLKLFKKTFTSLFYHYKGIVLKYNFSCRHLNKKSIYHSRFYGYLINKANRIRKYYDLAAIFDTRKVFFSFLQYNKHAGIHSSWFD